MTPRSLLWRLISEFNPPAYLSPSEWCEQNLVLPTSSNAIPGPLKLTPYQRGIVDALADDTCDTMVLELASQTGKSLTIDCLLSYAMARDPGPILVVHPTDAKATDYIRSRLNPLIKASPALREIIGGKGTDSLSQKQFPGGSLHTASSYKPDDLAARAIRYVFLDEVDRFANSAGQEGDPVALATKRTRTFSNRKRIIASTPTAKGISRVDAWFQRGTQERFFVPCPECGSFDYFRFDQLKFQEGQPHTAHMMCDDCAHSISERERLAAIELGVWKATNPNPERGIRSFHATELISFFSTLESVAAQSEEANTPEKRRVFQNTTLAEVSDLGAEIALDAHELQQRAEPIRLPYPADILFISVGVDVQADRLEATFVGFADPKVSGRAWVLNHYILPGDTSSPAVWNDLDKLLGIVHRTADGRNLAPASTAIDAGYNTTTVAEFVVSQRRKSRNVLAIKGVSGFDKLTIRKGSTLKGLTTLYLVGVDSLKANIHRRLSMQEPGFGFIHLPDHLDAAYFDGMTAESLKTRYVRGYARREWSMTQRGGGGNEPLDCLTYAMAIATITKAPVKTAPPKNIAESAARLNAASNSPRN